MYPFFEKIMCIGTGNYTVLYSNFARTLHAKTGKHPERAGPCWPPTQLVGTAGPGCSAAPGAPAPPAAAEVTEEPLVVETPRAVLAATHKHWKNKVIFVLEDKHWPYTSIYFKAPN